jgi:uncharacterized protein with HEPN domain
VPPREWRLRIEDIVAAIERVERYTAGMSLAAFEADEKTVEAVAYCFIVIGEAARHVPDDIAAANPDVPWAEMRAMRNIAVHEYFGVTLETLWKTSRDDLPPLVERLRALLAAG